MASYDKDNMDSTSPKPLISHEPIIHLEQSSESASIMQIGPLLSTEPGGTPSSSASEEENKPLPLVSREPIEDEYHGYVDINPDVGFSNQSESPIFGRSVDMEASNFQPVQKIKRTPRAPKSLHQRVESIEAKMDLQDKLHRMSKHDLLTTKEKIEELEVTEHVNIAEIGAFKVGVSDQMSSLEDKLHVLTMKVDEHIDEADKKEKERVTLVAENNQLRRLVNELIERADRERRELPDVIVKLEQKLKEVTEKLSGCEKDMKSAHDQLRSANDELRQSRQDATRFRKKSESLEVEKVALSVELREREVEIKEKDVKFETQELLLENQKRFLKRFEERCQELEETNKRLKKENGYFKETKFQVRPCSTSVNLISSMDDAAATARPSGKLEIGLECFSCGSGYLPSDHETTDCKFHPLPGMHYREWKLWPVGDGARQSDMSKLYWACCNKLSYGRPDGCCSGRHHQQWEMDITMKTVLLSKENLDWF